MTDTTANPPSASKHPSHAVYLVLDRPGQKAIFTRIGAAWPHKDGNGFSLQIDAVPLDGRLTLRVATEKKD